MSWQVKRKRPWWYSWIPATILSAILIGVAVTAVVLINGGLGAPTPKPTGGQVTDKNWSIFTQEGLDYIAASRQVRIDLSDAPVDAAALGLPADGTIELPPINTGDVSLDYSLIVNGGGEGQGGDKFVVSSISLESAGGMLTHVRAPLSEILNFRQTLNKLLGKAELFGWDTSGVDAIFQKVEDATRAGENYEFGFGPADRAGVPVSATASCDTTGYCVVEYDVAPAVR